MEREWVLLNGGFGEGGTGTSEKVKAQGKKKKKNCQKGHGTVRTFRIDTRRETTRYEYGVGGEASTAGREEKKKGGHQKRGTEG